MRIWFRFWFLCASVNGSLSHFETFCWDFNSDKSEIICFMQFLDKKKNWLTCSHLICSFITPNFITCISKWQCNVSVRKPFKPPKKKKFKTFLTISRQKWQLHLFLEILNFNFLKFKSESDSARKVNPHVFRSFSFANIFLFYRIGLKLADFAHTEYNHSQNYNDFFRTL